MKIRTAIFLSLILVLSFKDSIFAKPGKAGVKFVSGAQYGLKFKKFIDGRYFDIFGLKVGDQYLDCNFNLSDYPVYYRLMIPTRLRETGLWIQKYGKHNFWSADLREGHNGELNWWSKNEDDPNSLNDIPENFESFLIEPTNSKNGIRIKSNQNKKYIFLDRDGTFNTNCNGIDQATIFEVVFPVSAPIGCDTEIDPSQMLRVKFFSNAGQSFPVVKNIDQTRTIIADIGFGCGISPDGGQCENFKKSFPPKSAPITIACPVTCEFGAAPVMKVFDASYVARNNVQQNSFDPNQRSNNHLRY